MNGKTIDFSVYLHDCNENCGSNCEKKITFLSFSATQATNQNRVGLRLCRVTRLQVSRQSRPVLSWDPRPRETPVAEEDARKNRQQLGLVFRREMGLVFRREMRDWMGRVRARHWPTKLWLLTGVCCVRRDVRSWNYTPGGEDFCPTIYFLKFFQNFFVPIS